MDTQKAIELIEKSEHIGILLPQGASFDCLAAAEVLVRSLEKQDKKIGVVGKITESSAREIFKKISSSPGLPKEFIVSLDTNRSPVSQLRYEKGENRIDIILSPQSSAILKDAVSFRDGKMLCECIVALGIKNIGELDGAPGTDPDFFTNTPIINMDAGTANKNYGEANIVGADKSSISEIIYQFLSSFHEEPLEQESATLLLAGIISETDGFRTNSTSADTMLVSSELMRLGALLNDAHALLQGSDSVGMAQLLGRASVRSRMDEKQEVLWSFVTKEDFKKTGRSPEDISKVLSHLDAAFPPHRVSASLWQDPESDKIYATMSGERRILETIESTEGGEFQSPYLKLFSAFSSFREAEDTVTSLLRKFL